MKKIGVFFICYTILWAICRSVFACPGPPTIILPTFEEKVVLPNITVKGTVAGSMDIEWSLNMGGEIYTTSTASGVEGTLNVSIPHPQQYYYYGNNAIVAKITDYNGQVRSTFRSIICFFAKMGTDLREAPPAIPNFYRYWKQTNANKGTHSYSYDRKTYGHYRVALTPGPQPSSFYISQAANESIDEFAETCLHEDRHRLDAQDMWPSGYPLPGPTRDTWDRDHDLVKNSYESIWGFNPDDWDTDGDGYKDFEDRGYNEELNWTSGDAKEKDWSEGGAQWDP